ncbi:MAG: LysR family transcriptional regulator [Rhodospirillaceae bacterium]|nr:LysR family transcriptional regulator [Rhodospirillaceae bacterium]
MSKLRQLIANPSALLSFEAAARLLSFTKAAEELGVSQAAVSAAIRTLEGNLAVRLFVRDHQRVRLTEAGKILSSDVAVGFGYIARSIEVIRRPSFRRHVTLSTSTAFASHWIIPRLPGFRLLYPEIDLRIQTSDRDLDLERDELALGIRRGNGQWESYQAEHFADEILFPVCSSGYLDQAGRVSEIEDLARCKLIHLEEPHRPRPTWTDWFAEMNLSYKDDGNGLRLNDYGLVVQAAIGSQGVALGWAHIVDHPIQQKLLHRICDWSWSTGHHFYLVRPKAVDMSLDTKLVMEWILAEAATLPRRFKIETKQ